MESQSRLRVTSLNCCPLTQILKLRIASLMSINHSKRWNIKLHQNPYAFHHFCPPNVSFPEKAGTIWVTFAKNLICSQQGSCSSDTWSRYVTSVTWLLSHLLRSWHQVQGRYYPGQGCHLANAFSQRKLKNFIHFQVFCYKWSAMRNWLFTNDHILHSWSDIHQEGRTPIKLNGVFCFLRWMTMRPKVLSLLAESCHPAAVSCPLTPINSGQIDKFG